MSLDKLTETEQEFADAMAADGIPITEADIKARFEALAESEGLTFQNPSENSAWWRWLRAIAVKPFEFLLDYMITVVMPGLFVKTATGAYLDLHGWRLDVERNKARKTVGSILFTRDNVGVGFTIAKDTIIQTAPINGVTYQVVTTEDGVFSAGISSISIAVEAVEAGAAYNLAANYYVVLPEPISGITSVTNTTDWITTPGLDREDDDNYRQRIRAKFSAVSDWHINAVYKTLISEYSGISIDRIFIDQTQAPRGAGSADGLILFDVGTTSTDYIDNINEYISDQGYHGLGDDFQVQAMPETTHDLTCTVWVAENSTDNVKASVKNLVEQMTRCAFRENSSFNVTKTWPTARFSFGKLTGQIIRQNSEIISIEWENADIVSGWNIPRIHSLTVTIKEDTF